MPSVERRFILTKGPPWGFRLYLDNDGILTISKIRRHSPAEVCKLRSGDQILSLNGRNTNGMSHAEAVNFIDTTIGTLEMVVSRFESVSTKIMTSFDKPDSTNMENIKTNLNLDLKRTNAAIETPQRFPAKIPEVETKSQPEEPIETKDIVQPSSPDVQPISIHKLIREYKEVEEPYNYIPKKKHFADSAFYNDPQNLYPSIEERVDMARRVALSLTAPDNRNSKGANIFEKQRKRADKYTLNKEETPPPAVETETYDLKHWPQVMEPRERSPSPMFKLGYSTTKPVPPPPPPPPPPNEAKTIPEFMEKVKKFPKTKHNEITPQLCFDIAAALHTSDSRGAQIFAQKMNRSKKWELTAPEPVQSQPQMASNIGPWNDIHSRSAVPQQTRPSPRAINVVRNNTMVSNYNTGNNDSIDSPYVQARKPTHVIRRNSNQGYQEPPKVNKPISMTSSKSLSQPQTKETSQIPAAANQWKPVKFNIPQKA